MKKVSFYLFIIFIVTSCNSTKRVGEKEHLLKSTAILIDGKKNKNSELLDYVMQKPNTTTLGIPISLYFQNIGNPDAPQTPSAWARLNTKKYNFFKSLFSEKQSIGVANTFIGLNNWFLKNGEPPVIIDAKKTNRTAKNLQAYFKNQGYFKTIVATKKDSVDKKKGEITYIVDKGNAYFLDTISTSIPSSVLKKIYENDTVRYLKSGDQYNNQSFINEGNRITKLFRNSGIYNFSDGFIRFYPDSTRNDNKTNVTISISENYEVEKNGRTTNMPFKIQTISKIKVYTDYSHITQGEPYLDSISHNGMTFYAHQKVKYNPKYLSQSIFIKPNQIYSDTLRNLTRSHLKSLKNFKAISINYIPIENTDLLIAEIKLTPIEKFTIGTETELTHSNIRTLGISGKFSITNRNSFKGAELFKFSFSGSFFNTSTQPGSASGFFNAWEMGVDASLELPRFFAPFGLNKLVPKEMSPKTILSLGTGIQKNIGLDKQTITGIVDYNWQFNSKKSINLELLNVQYIRNLNTSEYFNIYNSEFEKLKPIAIAANYNNFILNKENAVSFMNRVNTDPNFQASNPVEHNSNANINNRYNIITSNFIIPIIAYSYTYNNQQNYKDNNFSFFKVRVANSGAIVSLFSNQTNSKGVKTISETPIAQYFKVDLEYKQFWDVSRNSVLGFRSFLGVVLPYGKSDVPFSKSYFAGGSNDIRAWKTFELGPGSTAQGLEYNIGNFKFLSSLEYRFDLISNLKGALFIDAGNVWELSDSQFVDSKAKLNSLSALKQIAVGSGFGARYDFNFLVLRVDLGFKTYEPYLNNNKWFNNFNFNNAVYNIGINYPF